MKRALACGYSVEHLFYCPEIDTDGDIHALPDTLTRYDVPADILNKISYRNTPSSVVAVMQQPVIKTVQMLESIASTLILGIVGLRKPGNIGALLRTADATGFKAILLIDSALDLYNPNIIRSSTGAIFLNNIYTVTSEEAIAYFEQQNYQVVAGIVDGDTPLTTVDFSRNSAVMLGTEDIGLDEFWQSNCDIRVKIPMVGDVTDSFNVSVSGAIFMYEALRQTHTT